MSTPIETANIPRVTAKAEGGAVVGYARVSSYEQSVEIQMAQLVAAGCRKIFTEKVTGTNVTDRAQLQAAIEWVRDGDVLVVTRLDRFARSMKDLSNLVSTLEQKGVGFVVLLQPEISTTSPHSRLLLHLLGAFAQFENEIRASRTREGMKVYRDTVLAEKRLKLEEKIVAAKQMKREGYKPGDIINITGIRRDQLYRELPGDWLNDPEWIAIARRRYGDEELSAYLRATLHTASYQSVLVANNLPVVKGKKPGK